MNYLELIELLLKHKVWYHLLQVAPWFAASVETVKQFAAQFKRRLISQLITDILIVLKQLLKYFNGTIISTFLVPSSRVWPFMFSLKLNESVRLPSSKSIVLPLLYTAGMSLQYYHKLQDVFE